MSVKITHKSSVEIPVSSRDIQKGTYFTGRIRGHPDGLFLKGSDAHHEVISLTSGKCWSNGGTEINNYREVDVEILVCNK